MTNERYNQLFRDMVLTGYVCGVTYPWEVLCNYDRIDFIDQTELDEFLNKAIVDIYSALQGKDLTFEEANALYDEDINWKKHDKTEEK